MNSVDPNAPRDFKLMLRTLVETCLSPHRPDLVATPETHAIAESYLSAPLDERTEFLDVLVEEFEFANPVYREAEIPADDLSVLSPALTDFTLLPVRPSVCLNFILYYIGI